MYGQYVGRNRSQGHGREVLERIVGDLPIEARIDDVARGYEHDGVTVGCGACGVAHADIAASTNLVLDVELLSEILGKVFCTSRRANTSVGPAGANGTLMRTGCVGKSCAPAATGPPDHAPPRSR